MSGFSVTYDDERAQALLQRLSQIVARPRQALTGSAQALRRLIKDTFQDQRDPWGRPWTRHAPATAAARDRTGGGGSILFDTGRLSNSVDAIADENGVTAIVSTDYASYHQFGNPSHRAWGGPVSPLPQRAFLPERAPGVVDVPASWWYEILFPVQAAIDREVAAG